MHDPRIIRLVEGLGTGGILGLAAAGAVAVGAAVPAVTPLVADVGLGLAGGAALGAAGWAWSVRRRVRALPLELGPVAASGQVDGQRIYRVRARLGHGRALRDPQVQACWVPAGGEPEPLPGEVAADRLVGPFTVLVRDPQGVIGGAGTLEVRVLARAGGRTWEASARYPAAAIARGRFLGLTPGRRLRFTEDWAEIEAEEPVTPR